MEEVKRESEWYDNPNFLTSIILGVIIVIIILSQAFAVKNNIGTLNILRSLFNHNSTYVIALVYFALIKFKVGKKYFNFINVFYIFMYVLIVLASFLTIFQSFGIFSLTNLLLNLVLLFFMIYTFLGSSRYWKEFNLDQIPFDEVSNEWYFYSICILSFVILLANLIGATNFDSVILSLFDAIYIILFGRYIYLYKEYEDHKKSLAQIKKKQTKKVKKNEK